MTRHVVLLAHGSRDPRHARDVSRMRDRVATALPPHVADRITVWASYLELCGPQPTALPIPPGASVTLLPLFLAEGYHLRNDVPVVASELAANGAMVDLLPAPLMATSGWPLRLLNSLDPLSGTTVLVVTAGSSDTRVVDAWDAAARRWSSVLVSRGGTGAVRVAHATGPGTRPETVARQAGRDGVPVSTLVPALVADGHFADRARASAAALGSAVTDVVGTTDAFTEHVVHLLHHEAAPTAPAAELVTH
jgi:sirohydrochlorin ferrochelatase